MNEKEHKLKVGAEHHSKFSGSEVIRVDICGGAWDGNKGYSIVVEHLASQKCVVVDFVYPDGERLRHENIYYDQSYVEHKG